MPADTSLQTRTDSLESSLEKLSALSDEFSHDDNSGAKNEFNGILFNLIINLLKNFSQSQDVEPEEKIFLLTRVYEVTSQLAHEISEPELSKVYWQDRPVRDRQANVFNWIKDNFPSYGRGLHQGHIYNHDRPLYRRLHDSKPWPSDFDLPTFAQFNDIFLENAGPAPSLKEISEQAPPNIRNMIRHYELERGRKRKKSRK